MLEGNIPSAHMNSSLPTTTSILSIARDQKSELISDTLSMLFVQFAGDIALMMQDGPASVSHGYT